MAEFIFAYHGGKKPDTPEAGAEVTAKWQKWMDSLGDALVNPGSPVGLSKTVTASGVAGNGGSNPLDGFSIVVADSIEQAVEMAKGCPHLESGSVEVAEVVGM